MITRLERLHRRLEACTRCPKMIGPVIHGPPVDSRVMLLGQAPGPHEGKIGRPFGWTAGKKLFQWFFDALGVDEATFRRSVYIAAVARCFPGKAKGGGDRKPDPTEIANCRPWLQLEVSTLQPKLVLPVGTLAIEQVLGTKGPLVDVVGKTLHANYLGADVEVISLPHPSGASTWHHSPANKALIATALQCIGRHPAWREAVSDAHQGPQRTRRGA